MNTIIKLVYIIICVAFLGCKKENGNSHDATADINIEKFIPTEGDEGTEMMIFGSNFSSDTAQISVYINGIKAHVTGVTMDRILLMVPAGKGIGPVEVQIGNKSKRSAEYFKFPPVYRWRLATLAGNGIAGYQDGVGNTAQFNLVRAPGIAVDTEGTIYVADDGNHCIRKITPDGTVTTFAGMPGQAGYQDGNGTKAKFDTPFHVSVDKNKNVYVSDTWNAKLRKIDSNGEVTTLTGVGDIVCTAIDPRNNQLYAASLTNGAVYQVHANGNLSAVVSGLGWIGGITIDAQGMLYIVETGNSVVHQVDLKAFSGDPLQTAIIAGTNGVAGYVDDIGVKAKFDRPWGIACQPSTGELYIAGDSGPYGGPWYGDGGNNTNQCIRLIKPRTWAVSTFFGTSERGFADGLKEEARLNNPTGVTIGSNGTIYIVDTNNQSIRQIIKEEVL
ncbi:IPT/TIG domain-containing protein [Sphingobacterium faecale]|uniref:IPT/TIG domain-containing protein n=1 Tax=Sphingobacterium faecale TaxID=2803775 RepID=A0ABS1R362_9SPHI|nr:IPT/TIG domain-containing protein [Sphingobacterium faecale]MBL1409159.1 IPT/TIG domain-containing protein [Sphingobacterium faecale]